MEIIAKTFSGLENILKNEIEKIGGKDIEILKRSVRYTGNKKILYLSNYTLRTAIKILMPIYEFRFSNIEDFYKKIYNFEWEKYFEVDKTISVEPVVFSKIFKNTHFAALKAKDAIVDHFRAAENKRPNVDVHNPNVKINIYIRDNYANISIDTSGQALFKRGWRRKQGAAPLNEVLAAGIIKLSQWNEEKELLDFMCGSGTIPIEAAFMAMNIAPQFKRKEFGFMFLKDYDDNLWKKLVNEVDAKQNIKSVKIFASDISQKAVDIAAENIAYSGLSAFIELRRANFEKIHFNSPKHIIFNPPYGRRIGRENEMFDFYRKIGDTLKKNFKGSEAWMITGNLKALKHLGLRTSKKIILYNGPIETRLVKYDIF
jgi:putative N6-adenine-specific DNA methylase